jgi:methylglyoxal synthase
MSPKKKTEKKTIIGVLASHDSVIKNNELARAFENLYKKDKKLLEKFHFLFTGGTFQRVVLGKDTEPSPRRALKPIKDPRVIDFLKRNSTTLPDQRDGGVTILANLIVQRQCSILWSFLTPLTMHWLNPADLALNRLSDICNVNRLMNRGSVETWFSYEARGDVKRNLREIPPKLLFGCEEFDPGKVSGLVSKGWLAQWKKERGFLPSSESEHGVYSIPKRIRKEREPEFWLKFKYQTVALIAHDAMKERMVDFAVEYERELSAFERILSTGTTGREVENATRKLKDKIKRYNSGPKGGDVEIATEILYGRCDVVIFFLDPLHPHPHIEDIRVVFGACMIEDEVRMLTNEVEARKWMDRVVRPNVT